MKVSIIIPNWNGENKLKRNLPQVLQVKNIYEVIISDDASSDESVETVKKEFSEVKVVVRRENRGFSSNVNTGVSQAKGDLVFLLNNDAVPARDCLEFILPHFQNPKVFSVGCSVGEGLWATGRFENGFFWHSQAHQTSSRSGLSPSGSKTGEAGAHQTLWASGGSGVFRKSIWDQLGGLDTLYNPFYEEDVDLGYRATKRGHINIWEPKSKVEHYRKKGVIAAHFRKNFVEFIAQRNQLIFIWKNITSKKLTDEHKKALLKMLVQHPKYWNVFLAAAWKLPQILKKREIEKRQTKLSDEEIFSIFAGEQV